MNFGDSGDKEPGSGFGFGGWGSSWNTSNKWDLGGTDTTTADITDNSKDNQDASLDGGDGGIWSFGTNKKNKKKTTNKGFDFELGAVDEANEPKSTTAADVDDWGGFGKKDKKNKKKGASEDTSVDIDSAAVGIALDEPATNDSWNTWGTATSKKDKKKGKPIEAMPQAPPPPPAVPSDPAIDNSWGTFNAKKDKKGKRGAIEALTEEPAVVAVPEPEAEADGGWPSFETKKDKKKGKKNQVEEKPDQTSNAAGAEKDTESPEVDFGWDSFGTGKKDKKKTKKGAVEGFAEDSFATPVPEPEPVADLGWGFEAKKDKKKGKKGAFEEPAKEESLVTDLHETGSMMHAGWGAFPSNKDNKSKNKGFLDDFTAVADAGISQVSKPAPAIDDTLGSWGNATKKDKKAKKGLISEVRDDPIAAIEPVAAAEALTADDDLMNWLNHDKKKEKKNKKGATADTTKEEILPPPPPPPPVAPEPSMTDIWGSAKKDKKGKKGGTFDKINPDPVGVVPESIEEDWGGWGLSAKDKRKKEKEKEKERKEREEQEREEQEKEEKEAEEKAEKEEREQAEKEEKEKAEKLKVKEKPKPGKKTKTSAAAEASKMEDLMKDSVPDATPAVEEDIWANGWGSSKNSKKKGGKNTMPEIPPPVPTPPAQGLTPEPGPIPGLDDMGDGEWTSFAPAKPKGKKDLKTTSKIAKAEESKAAKKGVKDKADDSAAAEEFRMKEESAAKAAKNFWGGMGTTTTSKSKTAKDKDKNDDHSKGEHTLKDLGLDLDLDLDDPDNELIGIIDEPQPAKKPAKSKTDGKLSKTSSKDSKASDKASTTGTIGKTSDKKKKGEDSLLDDLLELGDEEAAGNGGDSISNLIDANEDKNQNHDAWNFWGSTKKPSGKKADEGRKEIAKAAVANQKASLKNEPEATSRSTTTVAADESASQPSKSSKTTMSTIKASNKTSSVLQRVKDLEKGKEGGKAKSTETQPPAFASETLSKTESPPKKSNTTNKLKPNSASAKKKNSPPLEAKSKFSQLNNDTVPGSFPAEGAEDDDDMADMIDFSPVDKTNKSKPAKAKKQELFMEEFNFDDPAAEVPPAPPTPPADPPPAKPAKKERARVVRDEGASSWGFWGAAPKKDAKKERKAKDDADVPAAKTKEKAPAPGLVRSKSTKTAKEKDKEVEKSSKSSGSDEKEKKSEPRPAKSRGSSFGGFFGPPPARAKTVRRPSTAASKPATSRRPSVDVAATGLPSPPVENAPEMNAKAAKLMGASPGKLDRKASVRGKQKTKGSHVKIPFEHFQQADALNTVAPDPYPIDEDDMVMIGGVDDPVIDFPPAPTTPKGAKKDKSSSSKTKPKKEVSSFQRPRRKATKLPIPPGNRKHRSIRAWTRADYPKQPIPVDDMPEDMPEDIVMVDPISPQDELDSPKEHLAFDERPRLQRANTSAKKSKGGGIFGGFGFGKTRRAPEVVERSKSSKGAVTDDEGLSRRKRTVAGGEDSAKRLRRDDRKVRRSDKPDRAAEGFVYPEGGGSADAEDAEAQARREERRAKRAAARDIDRREAEKAQEDARKAKAKDARDRRARKEEEAEAQRLEDKRARRAAREEMNVKLGGSRPRKSDRRKSYLDSPAAPADEDAERRARREARRTARTPDEKSKTKAADDYFDPRNGDGGGGGDPYLNGAGGNDHTSSWVKSQLSDPADPPPVEGTVIDPPPVLGETDPPAPAAAAAADEDEAARKARRKSSRRQSKYVDEDEDARRTRRKEREVRSSEGSRDDERPYYASSRRKSDYSGLRSYEARPSLAAGGKRGSWFKKMGL